MRIAYMGLKGLPARSGADRVAEAIIRRVGDYGIVPTVYCDANYTPVGTEIPGVKLLRLPTLPGKHLRVTSLDILAAFHALFVGQYDLIHLHNMEAGFILPLLRLRYRVVSTSHGGAYWRAKWGTIAKWLMQMMDFPFMTLSNRTTFVSARDAREFGERFGRETIHIPNGVGVEYEPDLEKANHILRKRNLESGQYFLFIAGRIEPTKGAHLAIDAINQIGNAKLLVVGDDQQIPVYGRKLRGTAGNDIFFEASISDRGTVFGLMVQAQSLIFPSLVEAMSMILLEAASLGVPIICSDIEENRQVLHEDALYFPSGSVDALIEQIRFAQINPEKMKQMGINAQLHTRKSFSWDAIVPKYVEVYQGVFKEY